MNTASLNPIGGGGYMRYSGSVDNLIKVVHENSPSVGPILANMGKGIEWEILSN